MLENSMVVFRDCDNPWEDDHTCSLCSDYFDEPDSYKDEDDE